MLARVQDCQMNPKLKKVIKSFALELVIYGAAVIGYFFLVLHFMGSWLEQIFRNDRKTYALMSLLLMLGQGLVLEKLTRVLLNLVHGGKEEDGQ
jgi:hypothetical protein